jgi:hypothetical protein
MATREQIPHAPTHTDTRKITGGPRSHRSAFRRNSLPRRVRARLSYISWYVRTLVSETRSLPQRMRILSERTNHLAGHVDLGPLAQETKQGHLVSCTSTISRMQCIESVSAKHPWATDAELLIALDAWEMGSEYTLRNQNQDTSSTERQLSRDQVPFPFLVEQ